MRGWRTVTGVHNYEPRHLSQAVDFLTGSAIDWDAAAAAPTPPLADVPHAIQASPGAALREAVRFY